MTERVFEALGMADSATLFEDTKKHPRLATGYLLSGAEPKAVPLYSMDALCPAGGMSSSAEDVARWLRLLLAEGRHEGEQLVGERELREMWKTQIEGAEVGGMMPGADYGLGWFLREWEGHRVVEHPGNGFGYSANIALIPELGIGYVMLSNLMPNPLEFELNDRVWRALAADD